MSVTIRGLDKLNKRLKAIQDGRGLLQKLQLDTVREAKLLVPRKTGNLGRSIAPGSLTSHDALVIARAGYARYVEEGTRPHIIEPRNKKALAWPASASGRRLSGSARRGAEMAFAKRVHHPGTKPHPFMLPGAKAAVAKSGAQVVVDLWNEAA